MRVAGALVVDGEGGQGQAFDGLDDEVGEIILGHPAAQVRGQAWRCLTVGVFEAVSHVALWDAWLTQKASSHVEFLARKSPTGCYRFQLRNPVQTSAGISALLAGAVGSSGRGRP